MSRNMPNLLLQRGYRARRLPISSLSLPPRPWKPAISLGVGLHSRPLVTVSATSGIKNGSEVHLNIDSFLLVQILAAAKDMGE